MIKKPVVSKYFMLFVVHQVSINIVSKSAKVVCPFCGSDKISKTVTTKPENKPIQLQ